MKCVIWLLDADIIQIQLDFIRWSYSHLHEMKFFWAILLLQIVFLIGRYEVKEKHSDSNLKQVCRRLTSDRDFFLFKKYDCEFSIKLVFFLWINFRQKRASVGFAVAMVLVLIAIMIQIILIIMMVMMIIMIEGQQLNQQQSGQIFQLHHHRRQLRHQRQRQHQQLLPFLFQNSQNLDSQSVDNQVNRSRNKRSTWFWSM